MPIELPEFRKSLTYATQAPITNVITELQEIVEIDHLAEVKQKEHGKKALYYFLSAIASIVLIIILVNINIDSGLMVILLFLIIICLIIACIYELVMRGKFKKLNIDNYRYGAIKNIVQMLARDMDEAAVIELQLSFQTIDKKENKTNTIPHPHKQGWKIDSYQYEWLKMKGQFLDKTRFELNATGISKKQYGWKRGSSGKNKYKSKTKSGGLDINLHLIYPQRRYGAVKVLRNEVVDAIKLPELSELRGLKVTEKAIILTVRIAAQVAENQENIYQTMAAMFLSIYQVLNLAKMLSK
jgi:hypothetical protein